MWTLQHRVNHALRRFSIQPFAAVDPLSLPDGGSDHTGLFDTIYRTSYWGEVESLSGAGSTREYTARYAASLKALIQRRGFTSMFDAPCGDLVWMADLVRELGIRYEGGDISTVAVDLARKALPDARIELFDIRNDPFPKVDVWHCRDCLFHLSFADGLAALRNFANSDIPYALLTTHSAVYLRNVDIRTGGFRRLDLERAPFSLPKPLERLVDYPRGEFRRYVALWSREQIQRAIG